ncbi:DMT family transporter [Roseibium sp. SCP14]|uniref:DMT family transporter n=1 Tax=Roseibium sp. SCP14 TaxID=3141375 RepID=UPI00333B56B5
MVSNHKQGILLKGARPHLEFDESVLGVVLITLGIGVFSIQDVLIRTLGDTYPGFEIMFFRGLVAIGPIFAFVIFSGGLETLKVSHPWLNILRGLLALTSYTLYYMALQALPLAISTAIFFVSPLIVTLLSVLLLSETVGIRRFTAVLTGFIGVMVIVGPTDDGLSAEMVLPVLAAVAYAVSIIITRHIGKTQTGSSLAFYAMLTFIAVSGLAGLLLGTQTNAASYHPSIAFLLRGWVLPTASDAVLIAICGVIAAFGFYCLAQGYKVAPVSLVAPFEFVSMPLAVFWGFLVWSEVPSLLTLSGILVIIVSGVYLLQREARPDRKRLTSGRGVRLRL